MQIATDAVRSISRRYVALARAALGMDMAWLTEHAEAMQTVQAVDGAAEQFGVAEGDATPLESSYCARVLDGRLPGTIPDVRANPVASALSVTERFGIGSYAGTPVQLPGGRVYGMLCGFGRGPQPSLSDSDLRVLEALAGAMGEEIAEHLADVEAHDLVRTRLERAARGDGMRIVVQPIVATDGSRTIGLEALARFDCPPPRPDEWFADAARYGMGTDLELGAIEASLALLPDVPSETYLSLNVSPSTLCHAALRAMLADVARERIVVELTEHASVADYGTLLGHIDALRADGVRLAVDDAGAGYASFRHILALRPDVVKFDRALVTGIDADPVREALVGALVTLGEGIGATVVAEGVETEGERAALRVLGVHAVQGYLVGRPAPLARPIRQR